MSDPIIADIKPIGAATTMAIPVTRSVPAKTGMAPNDPELPTWSARNGGFVLIGIGHPPRFRKLCLSLRMRPERPSWPPAAVTFPTR